LPQPKLTDVVDGPMSVEQQYDTVLSVEKLVEQFVVD
jgi:hypothetical protein